MDSQLQSLNNTYAVPEQLHFAAGPGGLLQAVIENQYASATMTLMGGHVLTFTPRGQKPLLWVAPHEVYQLGKPFHSGVPVCWPWFGAHPSDPKMPMHGLVRTRLWSVSGARALPDGSTELRMTVRDTPETLALWPFRFELEVIATFGPSLTVEWVARNPGEQPYRYTGALHPYFTVQDVSSVSVLGLDGTAYLDKNENFDRFEQHGPVGFAGPVDRVYLHTAADLTIQDPGLGREIRIQKWGSHTTVVWNPAEKDVEIAAIGAGGHTGYVCVEAANAFEDWVQVEPGGDARLGMRISAAGMEGERS